MLKRSLSVILLFAFQTSLVFCGSIGRPNLGFIPPLKSNLENGAVLAYNNEDLLDAEVRNLSFANNTNATLDDGSIGTGVQASSSSSSNNLMIQLISSGVGITIMVILCSCCIYHCCCRPTVESQGVVIIDESRQRNETQPAPQPIYIVQQLPPMQQLPPQQQPVPYQHMGDLPPSYFQASQAKAPYPQAQQLPQQYQPMHMQQQSHYSPVYQQPPTSPQKFN